MAGHDPLSPDPTILGVRKSQLTTPEVHGLIAKATGWPAEDIQGVTFIVDLGGKFTMGSTAGIEGAKDMLVRAVMSGVLNTPDFDRMGNIPGLS